MDMMGPDMPQGASALRLAAPRLAPKPGAKPSPDPDLDGASLNEDEEKGEEEEEEETV